MKVIKSGWVFKVKTNTDGSVECLKACLVAKGYSQHPGFDYGEVFAPTVRYSATHLVLALAAQEDLHLRSVDISHAFTNGDLDEEIFMEQPEGFDEDKANYVCHLHKSLYGLKQAARQWNTKLCTVLKSMGFNQLKSDKSIFLFVRDDVQIILPVFVDDLTLASKSTTAMDRVVEELKLHFKLCDLGPTTHLLGIGVERDWPTHCIFLSQCQYILDLLECFSFDKSHPVSTPMDPGFNPSTDMSPKSDEEATFMKKVPYINAVGALMYLATTT
ncbi:MAG: reverse transcriptase domain-containing protein [Candidatus Saccharimonadales bacterium]